MLVRMCTRGVYVMIKGHGQMLVRAIVLVEAGSCVALICKTYKFVAKKVEDFLTTRLKNARIGSESILAWCCVSTSVDAKTT